MNFIRSIIGIPIFILVVVLAVINEGSTRFDLKPFELSMTVSVRVLIVTLFFVG